MQLQVREHTLDIWRSVVSYTFRDGTWHWGGRSGSNSISDAEQLLCILYPATNIPELRLDNPDEIAPDVLDALRVLGSDLDIVRVLTEALTDYMSRYVDADGSPVFSGGNYLEPPTDEPVPDQAQTQLDIVDSFSMSITLCLSTLGFIQTLRGRVHGRAMRERLGRLERLTSDRLTAALAGLLRSFSVHVFDIDSPAGRNLCAMVNQSGEPERIVGERLARSLKDIRGSLRDKVTIGSGQMAEELENPMRLLECGWSWGVIAEAPEVEYAKAVGGQRPGTAEDRPYLYFTGVALDGIEDLFSERTRILGLLTDEQQRLAAALQLRWDLCMQFWHRVATFGPGRWPLEDLPWRTTDGVESDHFSLWLASMLAQRLHVRGSASPRATRIGAVLTELAARGRITRRPLSNDPALEVHAPGTRLFLIGSGDLGRTASWTVSSYSSLLLKRSVQLAALTLETRERKQLADLSEQIWTHLLGRRLGDRKGEGLWDRPDLIFPTLVNTVVPESTLPSWYHTQRICECLVAAGGVLSTSAPVSLALIDLAAEFLAEAEHLFDQEKLHGTWGSEQRGRHGSRSVEARLERARQLQYRRPGTAVTLAQDVLRELDELAMARARPIVEDVQ